MKTFLDRDPQGWENVRQDYLELYHRYGSHDQACEELGICKGVDCLEPNSYTYCSQCYATIMADCDLVQHKDRPVLALIVLAVMIMFFTVVVYHAWTS